MKHLATIAVVILLVPAGFLGHMIWHDLQGAAEPPGQPAEETGTDPNHLQAAQAAHDRGNRLLVKAKMAGVPSQVELLAQAAVQFRVCLAYEGATPDAGTLFADARQALERSTMLLERARAPQRPADSQVAARGKSKDEPKPSPAPAPSTPKEAKPKTLPANTITAPAPVISKPAVGEAKEPKPATPDPVVKKPVKQTVVVGPDGVIYEILEKGAADNER
jgi:hypothetical protein